MTFHQRFPIGKVATCLRGGSTEAGREIMLGAIRESPLTFDAILGWRDALNEGKMLLRDIIDLDATYGGGFDRAVVFTPGETMATPRQAGSRLASMRPRPKSPRARSRASVAPRRPPTRVRSRWPRGRQS